MYQKKEKESLVNEVSCIHCEKNQQKKKKLKNFLLILGMVLLVSFISITIILLCADSNEIKVPEKFNQKTIESLSLYEQESLDFFVNELVDSYNQKNKDITKNDSGMNIISSERYLNKTKDFDDAFTTIKTLAKSNNYLSTASNGGFIIVMSAALGTTDPYENSSPEEVDIYIREQINKIIETYYQ